MKNKKVKILRGFDGDEVVADHIINEYPITVYGYFSKDTGATDFDFYDVFIDHGHGQYCINEGNPFSAKPKVKEIKKLVKEYFEEIDSE